MKIARFALLIVALVFIAAVTVCAAQPAPSTPRGTSTLSAVGDGTPRIYMTSGTVQISGVGNFLVSHNAKVTFSDQKTELKMKPGALAGRPLDGYPDFNGSATVTGEHFTVGMYGTGITLTATGAGYAILFGTGTFALGPGVTKDGEVYGNFSGKWTLATWMKGADQRLDQKTIELTIGEPDPYDDPLKPTPPPQPKK